MDQQEAHDRVDRYFRRQFDKALAEMEPSETPGYWHADGRAYLFAEWGVRRANGQFDSPYRAWRALTQPPVEVEGDPLPLTCPWCGMPWDRFEREGLEAVGQRGPHATVEVWSGPMFSVCATGHRFLVRNYTVRALARSIHA